MKYLEPILLCAVAILSLIISINNWNKLTNTHRMIVAFIIAALLIIAIVQITNIATNNIKEKEEEDKQALIERVSAKFGEIDMRNPQGRHIMMGQRDNGQVLQLSGGFIEFGPEGAVIKLDIENKKLLVNIIIRNFQGEAIAVIEDSTWTVFDDNYEYNDDDTGFELVTKGERDVFFQVFYRNDMIYLSGFLLNGKGIGTIIYNRDNNVNSTIMYLSSTIGEKGSMPKPSEIHIANLFKYPRGKYYGVRQ
jgi:hypothetical protein